jgi:RNA polymerase sigma-70 factor (ECF subfamily)
MSPSKSTDLAHLTETDIIGLARQGDAAAFEHLYKQHSRHVYAMCFRMAGNSSDAEELTQDAFLQVFRKIGSFRGESAFATWLHRITFNIVLMRFRKKKIGAISLEDTFETDDEFGTPPKQIGQVDLNMAGLFDRLGLSRAITQLPAGCKKMFLLHDVEGYGHEEIAKILGCSVGNSKSQLHKARVRLRKLLREQGEHTEKADRPSEIYWALPVRASAS